MCELFALNSKQPIHLNEYLKTFYSHSQQHPHGWGLAIIKNKEVIIEKEPIKAADSKRLKEILSKELSYNHVLAHIRLATMGKMNILNCHPFSTKDNNGRTWTLMHNGTLFNQKMLEKYEMNQKGDTDSERILYYIIDKVNKREKKRKTKLTEEELFELLDKIIIKLAKDNKLNLMMSIDDILIVHGNYKNSLYYLEKKDIMLVSTQPLSKEHWLTIDYNRVFGLRDGQIIFRGKIHEHEYIVTEEHYQFILENLAPHMKQDMVDDNGDLNYAKEYVFTN